MNMDSVKDAINKQIDKKVQDKVNGIAKELSQLIKYDAMVESIDLSELNVSVEKTSETEFNIKFDFGDMNDYHKQLVKDYYYKNGLKRRW